ncbi:putative transcription factor ssDNA-binding-TF family [Helianthus anomalus]
MAPIHTWSGAFKLTKEGFILLQFAPAAGVRQYDWSRKQVTFFYWFLINSKLRYIHHMVHMKKHVTTLLNL